MLIQLTRHSANSHRRVAVRRRLGFIATSSLRSTISKAPYHLMAAEIARVAAVRFSRYSASPGEAIVMRAGTRSVKDPFGPASIILRA